MFLLRADYRVDRAIGIAVRKSNWLLIIDNSHVVDLGDMSSLELLLVYRSIITKPHPPANQNKNLSSNTSWQRCLIRQYTSIIRAHFSLFRNLFWRVLINILGLGSFYVIFYTRPLFSLLCYLYGVFFLTFFALTWKEFEKR